MATSTVTKPAKVKREPIEAAVRVSDQLKRLTLGRKINEHQLDEIAKLAEALKVFAR